MGVNILLRKYAKGANYGVDRIRMTINQRDTGIFVAQESPLLNRQFQLFTNETLVNVPLVLGCTFSVKCHWEAETVVCIGEDQDVAFRFYMCGQKIPSEKLCSEFSHQGFNIWRFFQRA